MRRVLLIDRSGEYSTTLTAAPRRRGFEVHLEDQKWKAVQALRQLMP